jgi:hypothetical protein
MVWWQTSNVGDALHLFEKHSIMDMVANDQNPVNVKLDILFLASGRPDFVKSLHFHLYYSGYIRTSWSACGQV